MGCVESAVADDRLYAIHSDRRGAPVAMTDARRAVVWRAELAPGGEARTSGSVSLALRLPGQYADAESGLHDNWHRTYDPRSGRYLQPDPLGYPDGPDPYLYANGDPINFVDPAGLYQIDMHYYMTFFLALAAGLEPETARSIALAAQFIDDNKDTRPVELDDNGEVKLYDSVTSNQQRLKYYHFMNDTLQQGVDIHSITSGNQLNNLYTAYKNASTCAQPIFFGEMLHALADTYSHADPDNRPYDATWLALGVGHGLNDSDPDYTFDHWGYPAWVNKLFPGSQPNQDQLWAVGWNANGLRTMNAELAMFNALGNLWSGKKGDGVDFIAIAGVLYEFNKIGETEEYQFSWDENGVQTRTKNETKVRHEDQESVEKAFNKKIKILNDAIENILKLNVNLKDKEWAYSSDDARKNRENEFVTLSCDDKTEDGAPKNPGVILPKGIACPG